MCEEKAPKEARKLSAETIIQEHGIGPLTVNYLGVVHAEQKH